MPQIVYRGDGEIQVGPHRLIKDRPVEVTLELAKEIRRVFEKWQEKGIELILEPKPKAPKK